MRQTATAGAEEDLLLEKQLCFALTVAARNVVAAYKPVLDRLGLTHPQYLVMLALWEKSPRSVREISTELDLEPATTSPLLRRLEAAKFLSRRRAAGNERSLAVELTDAGAALKKEAMSVPGTMMQKLGLEREDVVQLHTAMTRLIAATKTEHAITETTNSSHLPPRPDV
jgi:DNA-binding MarR family transcriptional regulator